MHDTVSQRVISKCKNDRPWKKYINRKSAPPPSPFLGRPGPALYFHPF